MKHIIGENIRRYRKLNGMSQKYLATKIGLSTQGLLKIEKGVVSPRTKTIEKVLEALCITPNQLFGLEKFKGDNSSILHQLRRESYNKEHYSGSNY
jgi:Predicted transcriptional regulator with C-terminal CBS domains